MAARLWPWAALLLLAACATRPPAVPSAPVAPASPAAPARPNAQIAPFPAAFAASAEALQAFRRACPRLRSRADQSGLTTAQDWDAACTDTEADPAAFFRRHFTPVRLGDGKGFATGYFEPEIRGSKRAIPGAAPVLARPPELVDIDLRAWGIEGGTIRGLVRDGRVVRAPDRAAIEAGAFAGRGLELAWAADPVDYFFLQIQGSGRLRLDDGSILRVGYAGQNGHAYVPIGRLLKERGKLPKAGMAEIKAWLRAHPDEGAALMRENPSYVFMRRLPDGIDGPIGALGVPLIASANLAADPAMLPLGVPVWLETTVEAVPWRQLAIVADTGGAIKGPNRFDIFFGPGEAAARKAGALAAPAEAILLLPNAAAARLRP